MDREQEIRAAIQGLHKEIDREKGQEAKRDLIAFRFDILDPQFLQALAVIADYGAKKYGDFNYQKSRMINDKSPVNHILEHLMQYQLRDEYDHKEVIIQCEGEHLINSRKFHLAAIALNAMMEFWYENHPEIK